MASSSPSSSTETPVLIQQHLTCSICMELFEDPVTTQCGHTFCQRCLSRNCYLNDPVCPLCKGYLRKSPEVNIILRTLTQELKKAQGGKPKDFSGDPGEVACDACTGRKVKAHKSCLVCLASYCEDHLELHYSASRLKGHRLVAPVGDLDSRACLTHGRPLELYSTEQQTCVCTLCLEEGREVVSTETEWDRKKAELGSSKAEMQQRILEKERKVEEIRASVGLCKAQLEREQREMDSVFTAVKSAVEEAQREAARPLEERQRSVEREARELTQELQREISQLKKTVSELEAISHLEDHIHFLQTFPSFSGLAEGRDWTEVAVDTTLTFSTLRTSLSAMMEQIEQELEKVSTIELERILKFAVDVTLDPDTANTQLVLSEDGREVRDGGKPLDLPDSPDRFDHFGSVMGLNELTSGKSYWEVEVGEKTGWDLGVARGDANRKGRLSVNPTNGYWAIVLYNGDQYGALEDRPNLLSLREKPKKVGVFVDYEEGLVSFYDVEARSHIYSFTGYSFTGELYPYLSPHLSHNDRNSDPLILCPVITSIG